MKASIVATAGLLLAIGSVGCGSRRGNPAAEAPPPLRLERALPADTFEVDHPEQFPLVAAVAHTATDALAVTGTVSPDISRNVPVISLASGRVVEIDARLGDTVKKGQLLLRVQSPDVSTGYANYRKAVADQNLAQAQLARAQQLYDHGAISLNDLQVAQDAAAKAAVDVENDADALRTLGSADLEHPTDLIGIRAPISGVITDQQVTEAAGVQGLASPNPFTISDLSHVWVLCDVYENDLSQVQAGETADIRLDAAPGQIFAGRVSNIGPILDASIRTAKVRIELANPGFMRPGMFVTAVLHGRRERTDAAVPTSAIVHLHDADWVYEPSGGNRFRRVPITAGATTGAGWQEIEAGVQPGQAVVANALQLESTVVK